MPRRTPPSRSRSRVPTEGPAFVYVAPCHGEDLLKLGFSRDPLQRLQSLHRRFYDFFDLERGCVVELDTVREARDLELALRQDLGELNAPSPLQVEFAAAGHTEWFRGAGGVLSAATAALAAQGHRVHRPLHGWLRAQLEVRSDRLFQWADAQLQAIVEAEAMGVADLHALRRSLLDALDAYPALGVPLAMHASPEVVAWHRRMWGA